MIINKIFRFLQSIVLGIFILKHRTGFNVRKFSSGIAGVKSVLFLLPDSEEVCKAASGFVKSIADAKLAVTIVVHSRCRTHFSGIQNIKYIEYFPSDIAKLGYPKQSFREKMHFSESEALIAINFSDEIFLHICALLLKCRVKIGVKGKHTDWIYQMQFVPASTSIQDSVKSLEKYCHIT
ncbi:MAG: hypothetical protein HYV28_18425 [Ignavibacteriales bacterium]|nr:hypothetical protein [Ignavibacteriales bacterium]